MPKFIARMPETQPDPNIPVLIPSVDVGDFGDINWYVTDKQGQRWFIAWINAKTGELMRPTGLPPHLGLSLDDKGRIKVSNP